MNRLTIMVIACLVLTGCVTSNRIEPGGKTTIAPDRGVVVIGTRRADAVRPIAFTVDIRAVESGNRITTKPLDPDAPRRAAAISTPGGWVADPARFHAFSLVPGSYAIASIHPGPEAPASVYVPTFSGGGGGGAGAGLIALGVMLVIGAAAVIASELDDSPPPPKPDTLYVEEAQLQAHAPRFEVKAGEVLYLGDILVGSETRVYAHPQKLGPPERVQDRRLIAGYAQDPTAAQAFAANAGLSAWPFRTASLHLLEPDISYGFIASYRPVDTIKGTLVEGPTVELPSGNTIPPRTALAPTAPPTNRQGDVATALRERFLAGEISQDEYQRERTRLVPGK